MGDSEEELVAAPTRKHVIHLDPDRGSPNSTWVDEGLAAAFTGINNNRIISSKELREHNDLTNAGWIAVDGVIYDITKYSPHHPGGWLDLAKSVGDDGTYLFEEFHNWINPSGFVGRFRVGFLKGTPAAKRKAVSGRIRADPERLDFTKKLHAKWVPIVLESVAEVAEYTYRFSFIVNDTGIDLAVLWKKICPFHVILRLKMGNRFVTRPLSPVNAAEDVPGHLLPSEGLDPKQLHIVAKLYDKGHLSKSLQEMSSGSKAHCTFVFSHLSFSGNSLTINGMRGRRKLQGSFDRIGFVVAGTGIIPVLQVIQYILAKPEVAETVKIWVVYSAQNEQSLLFLPFLKKLHEEGSIALSLILSNPSAPGSFDGFIGKFSSKFLKENSSCLPKPTSDEDTQLRILLCGPPGYEEYGNIDNRRNPSVRKALLRNGWESNCIENFN